MRRRLPPTATQACARASLRPLLAAPLDRSPQHPGAGAPRATAGPGELQHCSRCARGRRLQRERRPPSTAGRPEAEGGARPAGFAFPGTPPPGNPAFSTAGAGLARASSAAAPRSTWYWRLGAGSLPLVRDDRRCPAAACNANIDWHAPTTDWRSPTFSCELFPTLAGCKDPPRGPEFDVWPHPRPAAATALQ